MAVGPLGMVGKNHITLLKKWIPSLAVFGGTGASLGLYFTEWRLICDWIPYYGGKFKDEEST